MVLGLRLESEGPPDFRRLFFAAPDFCFAFWVVLLRGESALAAFRLLTKIGFEANRLWRPFVRGFPGPQTAKIYPRQGEALVELISECAPGDCLLLNAKILGGGMTRTPGGLRRRGREGIRNAHASESGTTVSSGSKMLCGSSDPDESDIDIGSPRRQECSAFQDR